jgi:hypothetical protein
LQKHFANTHDPLSIKRLRQESGECVTRLCTYGEFGAAAG